MERREMFFGEVDSTQESEKNKNNLDRAVIALPNMGIHAVLVDGESSQAENGAQRSKNTSPKRVKYQKFILFLHVIKMEKGLIFIDVRNTISPLLSEKEKEK